MKRLDELTPAWGNAEPGDPHWDKDELIAKLRAEGRTPISVERAVVVIEQCEPADEYPKGWSQDPLQITVHPDPDAGFGTDPDVVHLHAGRTGLMEIFLTNHRGRFRMIAVPARQVRSVQGMAPMASAEALLKLANDTLGDRYFVETQTKSRSGATRPAATVAGPDAELRRLADEALAALQAYRDELARKPDLFEGFDEERAAESHT